MIEIGPVDLAYPAEEQESLEGFRLDFAWSEAELAALAPLPELSVSECADQHRILQAGVSRSPGPWRTSYTPYLAFPMDLFGHPGVRVLNLMFATQLGKTEAIYNMLLYTIAYNPYPTLMMYSREDDAKTISRTRVQPMVEDCEILRSKKPGRADLYQLLEMHFAGMPLYIVGANSLSALSQKPCCIIIRDEIDKYLNIGMALSRSGERAKSFWDIRKEVNVSSPSDEGVGIHKLISECHLVYSLHHPCPHCLELFVMADEQLRWDGHPAGHDDIPAAKKSACLVCPCCGAVIEDRDRPWMIRHHKWLPDRELAEMPENVGLMANSFTSPILTFGDFVEQRLNAEKARDEEGSIEPLKTYRNDWLNIPWKDTVATASETAILARAQSPLCLPPLIVPQDAMALTCGIDPQKHGFWFVVKAWNSKMWSWTIHYGFLQGWADVEQLVFETSFEVQGLPERRMMIWRAAMDIGGGADSAYGEDWTKTEEIITWIRENGRGVVHAVKGMSRETGPRVAHRVRDKMPGANGRIPGGMSEWHLAPNQFKDLFFWRLGNTDADPQPMFLHTDTGSDYARQILAEEKIRAKNGRMVYLRRHRDNHYLDCEYYATACADFQWMGGVKILSEPIYSDVARQRQQAAAAASQRRIKDELAAREELDIGPAAMVRNFQRPNWLHNRRR